MNISIKKHQSEDEQSESSEEENQCDKLRRICSKFKIRLMKFQMFAKKCANGHYMRHLTTPKNKLKQPCIKCFKTVGESCLAYWQCTTCKSYICARCEGYSTHLCPYGHYLKKTKHLLGRKSCDICVSKEYTHGKCCSCDYDICLNCLQKKKAEQQRKQGEQKLNRKQNQQKTKHKQKNLKADEQQNDFIQQKPQPIAEHQQPKEGIFANSLINHQKQEQNEESIEQEVAENNESDYGQELEDKNKKIEKILKKLKKPKNKILEQKTIKRGRGRPRKNQNLKKK